MDKTLYIPDIIDRGLRIRDKVLQHERQTKREQQANLLGIPYRRRLMPSLAGGCPRACILATNDTIEPYEYPPHTLNVMGQGNIMETDLAEILAYALPGRVHHESLIDPNALTRTDDGYLTYTNPDAEQPLCERLKLENEYWSGYVDIVIDHITNPHRNPNSCPLIIECKATGQRYWDYNHRLPDKKHVIQLAIYIKLYETQFGIRPNGGLYYRAWSDWAWLPIDVQPNRIVVNGHVSTRQYCVARYHTIPISIDALMLSLEQHLRDGTVPDILPDDEQEGNCLVRNEPWCQFFSFCFEE